jgi:site-specific recombinase XerD
MGNIAIRRAVDDYRTVYMAYRNFAERTREEYLNDIENLVRFVKKSGMKHVGEVGLPIIERYVAHLEQRGFASLTRKRKVVAIRSFLSFLYQDGYIETNIANKLVLPFTESTDPHVLTQAECDRLRNACVGNPRDRATIELLLQTGIRLSELARLTLNDIELMGAEKRGGTQTGFIRVAGSRGRKERVIPLNTEAWLALRSYLDARGDTENKILFLNRFGERLGERGFQRLLEKYLRKAEIGQASVRTLRHTFGAHHLAHGMSVKTLQEVMGHNDRRSTSVYASLANSL